MIRPYVRALLCSATIATNPTLAQAEPMPAEQAARGALPLFLKIVSDRPAWASKFRVLATVRDRHASEDFFLSDFRRDPAGFSAQLDTTPSRVSTYRTGQRIPILIGDIKDWTYDDARDGTTHGHFGICEEFQVLPDAESAELKTYWQLSCKP